MATFADGDVFVSVSRHTGSYRVSRVFHLDADGVEIEQFDIDLSSLITTPAESNPANRETLVAGTCVVGGALYGIAQFGYSFLSGAETVQDHRYLFFAMNDTGTVTTTLITRLQMFAAGTVVVTNNFPSGVAGSGIPVPGLAWPEPGGTFLVGVGQFGATAIDAELVRFDDTGTPTGDYWDAIGISGFGLRFHVDPEVIYGLVDGFPASGWTSYNLATSTPGTPVAVSGTYTSLAGAAMRQDGELLVLARNDVGATSDYDVIRYALPAGTLIGTVVFYDDFLDSAGPLNRPQASSDARYLWAANHNATTAIASSSVTMRRVDLTDSTVLVSSSLTGRFEAYTVAAPVTPTPPAPEVATPMTALII